MGKADGRYQDGYVHGCLVGGLVAVIASALTTSGTLLLVLAAMVLGPLLLCLSRASPQDTAGSRKTSSTPSNADPGNAGRGAHAADSGDPFRWALLPAGEALRANTASPYEFENELCRLKLLVMHKPTHDPDRMKSGAYPYGWHLHGRKRIWEIRLQLRFKRLPESQIYVGLESGEPVPSGGMARRLNEALVGTVRRVIGEMYASPGDDPARTVGEAEPPTMAVNLAAFDMFEVSAAGREPDLASDLSEVGYKRTNGVKLYFQDISEMTAHFSLDSVYTFCFWGVSQFLDCMNWEILGGALPGVRLDFDRFCGSPPCYFAMYELDSSKQPKGDGRHLLSWKKYYAHVAIWSELRPPAGGKRGRYEALPAALPQPSDEFLDAESSPTPLKERRGRSRLLATLSRIVCQ